MVYLIQCDKENCLENKYIGETEKPMHERGYVTRNTKDATGRHFNKPGHTLGNMRFDKLVNFSSEESYHGGSVINGTTQSIFIFLTTLIIVVTGSL